MSSLRQRLLWRIGLGHALVLLLFNAGLWWLARDVITRDFDERMAMQAKHLGSLIDQEGPYVEFDYKQELADRFEREEDPDYYQIWVEGVGVLDRSESLGQAEVEQRFGTTDSPEHWNALLPDGRAGRYVGIRFPIGGYEPIAEDGKQASRQTAVIVMASSRSPIALDMARFRQGLLLLDLGIVLASGLAVLVGVRAGLGPLRDLTRGVEELDANGNLEPLQQLRLPSELLPLSSSIQTLHQRLQQAIERERRLSGHIAHELRTPISELRTMTEVALYDSQDMQGLKNAAEQSRDVAIEMENIVSMLLRLWRQEAAGMQGERGRVDVIALVEQLQGRLAARAEERGLVWSGPKEWARRNHEGEPSSVFALAEAKPLALVLSNLLDNAVEHCPYGSEISWQVARSNGQVKIQIQNPQSMGKEGDPHGSNPFPHAGLGLSLAQRISDATGFALETGSKQGRWTAWLTVPAYSPKP